MTVWTNVKLEEANDWLLARNFSKAEAITPVEEGVEDSVFRVDFGNGSSACLRLFERTEPQGPLEIALRLSLFKLPTCPPIPDFRQRLCAPLRGKHAALYPWINGQWVPEPSLKQIEAIGAFLGQMAKTGARHCADWTRRNPRGWEWFTATANALAPKLSPEARQELEKEMRLQLEYWTAPNAVQVPMGPIHADLFRNNVLFAANDEIAAVIDWGFCASNFPFIFDLAIAANDWCLKKGTSEFDTERLNALLRGRNNVLPFIEAEQKAWSMALRWAALRFWLSRMHDWHFPRKVNGKRHDPDYFRDILRARRKM